MGRQQNCSIKYEIIQQKIPAREASHQFMARVRLQVNKTDQFEKESELGVYILSSILDSYFINHVIKVIIEGERTQGAYVL